MHFPVSFVIKTEKTIKRVTEELKGYISARTHGMQVLEKRYNTAIEEIITINELKRWTDELPDDDIDGIIGDMDIYYKLEMNMDSDEE